MVFRKRRRESEHAFTLYYASDVHGSDQCWRKFLGAGRFYEADALVMGGDLTGKAVVPVERGADGSFTAEFLGETRRGSGEQALEELTEAIRFNGMYPWVATAQEIERHRGDAAARGELFERVMLDELRRWVELADERMAPLGIEVYAMAGNDDPWSCDAVLEGASHLVACDLRVTR